MLSCDKNLYIYRLSNLCVCETITSIKIMSPRATLSSSIILPSCPPHHPRQPLICFLSYWILNRGGGSYNMYSSCLAYFNQRSYFQPQHVLYVSILSFYCSIVVHCIDRSQFVYSFSCWWTFGLFLVFDYCR